MHSFYAQHDDHALTPLGRLRFSQAQGEGQLSTVGTEHGVRPVFERHWDVMEDDAAYPQWWLEEHGGYNDNGELIVTALTEKEMDEITEQQVRWKGQNAKAKALSMHKCEEWLRDLIEDVDKAHEQWSKL